jgi:hypothetical protein
MIKVDINHFVRAAREIGHSGDNDTLPYDLDAGFVKDKANNLASLCLDLFKSIETGKAGKPVNFMNGLTIAAERLLAPSGPHGFRITTRIHSFWNLYLNGLGLATQRQMKATGAIGRTPIALRPKVPAFWIAAGHGAHTRLRP